MATTKDAPALVVVNGPIGGGKSTVSTILGALGATVIEADHLGHLVLEPGAEAHGDVAATWPEVVVDGVIDRRRLAEIVFSDRAELAKLERLTHPHIAARIVDAVERVTADTDTRVVVVEIPLVALEPLDRMLQRERHTITVLASEAVRRERAVARGMDAADVRRRIRAQPPPDVWEAAADTVIHNDGDRDGLRRRVEAWWARHFG